MYNNTSYVYIGFNYVLLDNEVEYWGESDSENDADVQPHFEEEQQPQSPDDIPPSASTPQEYSEPLIWWIVAFVSIFQTLHSISDRAISWLLHFKGTLLQYCGLLSPMLKNTAERFPNTIYLQDKLISGSDHIKAVHKYVSCPSCHKLHKYYCCFERSGAELIAKNCCNVIHKLCNSTLMKKCDFQV